jgi:hypothetical protein
MIYEVYNGKICNIRDDNFISNIESFCSYDTTLRLYDYDPRNSELNNFKNKKKHSIEDNFDAIMTNGYPTGNGYNLSASKTDRDAFTQDAVLHNIAVGLGLINNSDTVYFIDKNGITRSLIVSAYINVLVNYGLWCRQRIIEKSYKMGLLDNATSIEEINLIEE